MSPHIDSASRSPRRVLFLARLYWPHVGGVEKHLAQLILQLPRKKYTITVMTEQYDEQLPLTETWQGCTIIRIPQQQLATKLGVWSWIIAHARFFLTADIIHIHDVFWWQLPLALFVRHKSYITFHGYEGSVAPRLNQRLWHRLAALLTRANIGVGGFHHKWYGVTPTVTTFGAVGPVESKLQVCPRTIIFMGRLAADTGCLVYLQGFKLFTDSHPGWHLDIYGDGPQRAACEKYVKTHRLPVTFYGFVENTAAELTKYELAFVSRHLAILEALAVGVPVIAHYNNQIKKDYLVMSPFKDWIVPVHTAAEIAQAIPAKLGVPTAATRWASQQTWQQLAALYEHVWS